MIKIIKIVLLLSLALLFVSCGSSSSYTGEDVPQEQLVTPAEGSSITGRVVDGYIQGATVCLSLVPNESCQASSTHRTISDENGSFTFSSLDLPDDSIIYLVAFGGVDTSTNLAYDGELNAILFSSTLNDEEVIVSPLTDLTANVFLNDINNQDIFGLNDAKKATSDAIGIPVLDLEKDPMQDINIFLASQEIQQMKILLESVANKNADETPQATLLQNIIKKELVYQNLNISNIATALEVNLEMSIPDNEKEFLLLELEELTSTLDTLATEETLNVEDLNRLQLSIHNTIEEANQALLNASDGETIDIVAVDISSETITQSIFDTTAAIRDDLACVVSSGYTQFDNYSDEGYAGDAINGIHLKSNYSGLRETTKVSIFYPALEEELTENKLLYIDTNNNYYFTYDGAWTQNANKTIYIMTPKDSSGLHSCYRYELNNINPNAITKTKVFSYSNI